MDLFDQVMDKFLVPMADFTPPVVDSTYFLRKDGSFVFAEGYCHPPGALWGMIIKYPLPEGHIDVFGRPYSWTHREYVDGELVIVPFDRQVENQFKVAPELRALQGAVPPFAKTFVKFPLAGFQGYFDAVRSLRILREEYPELNEQVLQTCDLLDYDPARAGVSGSLAYGRLEDDVDLVLIGSAEEIYEICARIRAYKASHPEARVFELGKEWPVRFHYAGTLICPFFRYADPTRAPLFECRMSTLEEGLTVEGEVIDDLHTFYLPAILRLASVRRAAGDPLEDMELIIYHGAMRGELYNGDRVRATGDLVRVETPGEGERVAFLVTGDDQARKL